MAKKKSPALFISFGSSYSKLITYSQTMRRRIVLRTIMFYSSAVVVGAVLLFLGYVIAQFLGSLNFLLILIPVVAAVSWRAGFFPALLSITVFIGGNILFSRYILVRPSIFESSYQIILFLSSCVAAAVIVEQVKKTNVLREYRKKEKSFAKLVVAQNEDLKKAKKEIESRDEFLSIVSHELRTPLTAMLLQIQRALKNIRSVSLADFSVQNLLSMLEGAETQTLRLSRLINDLLNVSLITTGRLNLEKERINLTDLSNDVLERFGERLSMKNIKVRKKIEDKVIGQWDKVRIEQAFSNILSNAIKYGRGEPIEVAVYKRGANAYISVKDYGIGMSSNAKKNIFSLFERGENAAEFKGLGVGLYITNQIVKAHGGKIEIKTGQGKGSIFILKLPVIARKNSS